MKDKLEYFITIHDPDSPPRVDDIRKTPINDKSIELVVIDDYSNHKILMERTFSHYFTRGRHFKLSTICLVHSYFATPKMIRLNSEYVAILRANSKRDLKMVAKDFNLKNVDESKLIRAYDVATSSKGQALFVDSIRGELRFNFDRVIDPNLILFISYKDV